MMQLATVARPYSKALFEQAESSDTLHVWAEVLLVLGCFPGVDAFVSVAENPSVRKVELINFIEQIVFDLVERSKALQSPLRNFLDILVDDKRLLLLHSIEALYLQLLASKQDVVQARVTSAEVITQAQQDQIKKALEKRFSSCVNVEFSQDESLIGGAVIQAGSWVMDGSIQRKLTSLSDLMRG